MNEAWGAVVAAAIGGLLGGWITARSAVNQALTEGREQQRNWLLDQRLAAYTELLDAYDGVKKRLQDLITAQEDPFIDDNDPPSREIVQATGMLYESRERLALAMRRIDLVGPRSAMQLAVEAITLAVEAAFRTRLNYSVANHTDEERTDWLRALESVTATQIMFVEVAKVLLDVALAVALGGDCLADVAMLRAEPAVFGPVASDPTVSRLIDTLAASGEKALQAIRSARSEVRDRVWSLAGERAPDADAQVTVDLDGVLVVAHSDKEDAAATWKKTYGHHPLTAFVDHGPGGTGEPVAALLRPGNAGSNTAADHITTARLALAQLPKRYRRGRQTLIRTDSAGGTHDFVSWLAQRGRWLSYSVGMTVTEVIHEHVLKVPAPAWTAAVETNGEVRDGAWVADLTGSLLDGWPKGMRLILRKERPHPGAQLRITDADGMRITSFATNTPDRPIAELELRHRLRARAEDRIRAARSTGLRNLPLHHTAQNKVWLEIVQIALDLLAWMPMLAPDRPGPSLGAPPTAVPPVLRGRPARHHQPTPHPPPRPPLALDRREIRRP